MDFRWSAEQQRFRNHVRTFIEDRLPEDWERLTQGLDVGSEYTVQFSRTFCPELAREGLLVPHWPAEYGGADADAWRHWILNEEMIRHGEPRSYQYMSVNWAGPAIMSYGTPAQKEKFLNRISSGTVFFCQGFSEPSAGSDLSSLTTAAQRDGNGWLITGQKIWTSAASFADYCIVLARTGGRGRRGITVFIVPMDTPGIEVRVIKSLVGGRALHEVFLDNVHVPDDAILGEVDGGWSVVTSVMHHERIGIPRYILTLRALRRAGEVLESEGRFDDRTRARYRHAKAACEAARLQCYRVIDARVRGAPPSAETNLARVGIVTADRLVGEFLGDYLLDKIVVGEQPLLAGAYRRISASGIASGTLEIQLDLITRNHLKLSRNAA